VKNAIILKGKPFDWEAAKSSMENAVSEDGTPNFLAAMGADPGVMKCPNCGIFLWREGEFVECPDCGEQFSTMRN